MIITSLASSSRGNCYLIQDGVSSLLLECGININRIREVIKLTEIDGCLVTHEHQDHAKFAKDIIKYCPLYASAGTLSKLNLGQYDYRAEAVNPQTKFTVKTFNVVAYKGYHKNNDDSECEVLMYHIYSQVTKEQLLFVTDTSVINYFFNELDYLITEVNFSYEILRPKVRDGNISRSDFIRLIKSHLSLETVKEYLAKINISKLKEIYLGHLSDRNSDEKLFKKEIQELTGKVVIVCDS